jgi:hypothetical protein
MNASRYRVEIVNPATGRPKVFSTHETREAAEIEAAKLRVHKMFAQVRLVVDDRPDPDLPAAA